MVWEIKGKIIWKQGSHSLEKSLNIRGSPWKVLKFLCKSLKSPWTFFNFECSSLDRILMLFGCPRQNINHSSENLIYSLKSPWKWLHFFVRTLGNDLRGNKNYFELAWVQVIGSQLYNKGCICHLFKSQPHTIMLVLTLPGVTVNFSILIVTFLFSLPNVGGNSQWSTENWGRSSNILGPDFKVHYYTFMRDNLLLVNTDPE